MKTVGFIDYYLDEFHANHYPQWLKEASGGELEVKYAYGKITSPLTGMTSAQWCQKYGVELVESVEELIAKSDCLNVLSPDNPEKQGVPWSSARAKSAWASWRELEKVLST